MLIELAQIFPFMFPETSEIFKEEGIPNNVNVGAIQRQQVMVKGSQYRHGKPSWARTDFVLRIL